MGGGHDEPAPVAAATPTVGANLPTQRAALPAAAAAGLIGLGAMSGACLRPNPLPHPRCTSDSPLSSQAAR